MIMENNENLDSPSNNLERDSQSNVVDMMLGKNDEKVVDSEKMIQETQKRIWSSLKKGIEYDAKFVFETKFGDFPLKRYFVVKEQEINTRVKMQIF